MPAGFPSASGGGPPEPPGGETSESERTLIRAESPLLAGSTEKDETTEAGQETLSTIPTQRPEQPKPSPFAGLLAEAEADARVTRARPSQPAPAPAAPAKNAAAQVRSLGAYRILDELGSGGMAIVYKAVQPALDRLVAIKELRPEYVSDKQIGARFEREATSLGALQHGNIVHIYDFIRDVDSAYIVMEYVEGIDVFDLLHKVQRLPPDVAAIVALQLAEGLEYAHYHGIIHRDVKPSNLLVSKFGEVKIMDFGIARDPGRADLTQVGMSLGTPAYMAPEQIRGDKIDFRADLFAFGIVLYEMLTGRKPWGDTEGTSIARKVLYEDFVPPLTHVPDLPPALVRVIEICLKKDPAERFSSAHVLRRDIEAYLAHEVRMDPRQRLVVFLRNRGLITEADASSFVQPNVLLDGVLKRRDLGFAPIAPQNLLRPLAIVNGVLCLLVVFAAIAALWAPLGSLEALPEERPRIEIVTGSSSPALDKAPRRSRGKRSGPRQ